jgi:hypothetical protein
MTQKIQGDDTIAVERWDDENGNTHIEFFISQRGYTGMDVEKARELRDGLRMVESALKPPVPVDPLVEPVTERCGASFKHLTRGYPDCALPKGHDGACSDEPASGGSEDKAASAASESVAAQAKHAVDHECSRCGQSMRYVHRSDDSYAWSCPTHGFDRRIVTVYDDGSVDFPELRFGPDAEAEGRSPSVEVMTESKRHSGLERLTESQAAQALFDLRGWGGDDDPNDLVDDLYGAGYSVCREVPEACMNCEVEGPVEYCGHQRGGSGVIPEKERASGPPPAGLCPTCGNYHADDGRHDGFRNRSDRDPAANTEKDSDEQ